MGLLQVEGATLQKGRSLSSTAHTIAYDHKQFSCDTETATGKNRPASVRVNAETRRLNDQASAAA